MANPINNDFENWTSGNPDNWSSFGGQQINQTTDKYSGVYACEINIPSPSPWSGQTSGIQSSNFIIGDSLTFYIKKPSASGSLDAYAASLYIYIYRVSDNVILYSQSYTDVDLSTAYQQKTINTLANAGTNVYIKFYIGIPALCLPDSTFIETEKGNINILNIKVGDVVIGGKVLKTIKYLTPPNHQYYKFITEDGEAIASKNHPFVSRIIKIEVNNLKSKFTCDILTESGKYKVNGVWLKSTVKEK